MPFAVTFARGFMMAKSKKPRYRATYIRDWRKHRKLTLERLSRSIKKTASYLAKIERGELAYTQPVLEGLARELRCTPADFLTLRPQARTRTRR